MDDPNLSKLSVGLTTLRKSESLSRHTTVKMESHNSLRQVQ